MTGDDSHLHPLMTIHHLSFHPAPCARAFCGFFPLEEEGRRSCRGVRFREDVRNDFKILALAKCKGNDLCEHKRMTHFEWLNGFYGGNPSCCCKNVKLHSRYEQI